MQDENKKKKSSEFWRYAAFLVILFAIFIWLVSGLVRLQLNQADVYKEKAENTRTKTVYLRGKRGSIISSDSVILAEDQLVYNVTFQKDASANTKALYAQYTKSINDTIDIIEKNGGTMCIKYVIERGQDGSWQFNFGSGVSSTVLETREKQWRSNNYATGNKYKTAEQCIDLLSARYQIDRTKVTEYRMLQIMAIYSEMQMNIFNSMPIVIAKDVSIETVTEIETRSSILVGMSIENGTKRVYPRHTLASQIIGYTGAIPSRETYIQLAAKGYAYNDIVGRDGIEYSMEDYLTPNSSVRKGYKVVERDQMSRITRVVDPGEPAIDGNNVRLTLNAAYQEVAERVIRQNVKDIRDIENDKKDDGKWLEKYKSKIHKRDWDKFPLELAEHGCLIVLDMECRVLAMANYPTYDLNALVNGGKDAAVILEDKRNLLLNYAIHSRATPGSIFKMVTGFGGLASGELTPEERISDEGYYTKYNKDESTAPKCWISKNLRYTHMYQTIKNGIENSCNYFFYTVADRLGEDQLYYYAGRFGLTMTTGIDLPGEVRPVVGCQRSLYDPNKPVNEANQDTSLPIIVFNQLKEHLKNMGGLRNIVYEDERLSVCAKKLMDMAEKYDQGDKGAGWLDKIRTILMEELNMSREMVYQQVVIGDTYRLLNDIKWGGGQTILTGIGQSVTVLTPISVARYVTAVANGGKVYNVSLIDSITSPSGEILAEREPSLQWTLEKADIYMHYIVEGMKGVTDDTGTAAKYFKNGPYKDLIAAKTGTAQVTSIDLEDNAWFVCFAPIDNPEIAVVCFIPSGASGGYASQAPRDFIEWYMKQKDLRGTDIVLPVGNSLAP